MSISVTRAWGLAAALLISLLLAAPTALAAAPDPVAACDGTAWTATTVAGRAAVSCDDGWVRDWQRLAIADARVDRGTSGGATLTFVVSRPEAGNPVAVDWTTADGTARAGSDYTAGGGQLVLEADETSAPITVPVTSSARAGSDLQLSLRLADPAGVVLFDRDHAVGTIANRAINMSSETNPDADWLCDGGFFSLSDRPDGTKAVICLGKYYAPLVSAPAVDPRARVATFTVTHADGEDYGAYHLAYTTVDGTARAGVDYTATSGAVSLRSGQMSLTIDVPVMPTARPGGTFSLQLTTDRPGTAIGAYDAVRRVVVAPAGTATVSGRGAVDGTPRVGGTLTAAAADSHAWFRCDAAGACQPIVGAATQSYTPTAFDLGFTLRVRAVAPDPAGGTEIADTVVGAVRSASVATPAIDSGPAAAAVVRSPAADFAFSGKESDAAYECSLDGAAFTACDATLSLTTLASGPHRLSVRQRTVDGIASAASTRAWTVAAAPDGAAACDGTAYTTSVVLGRDVVACDDGGVRDWQRVTVADARVARGTSGSTALSFTVTRPEAGSPLFLRARTIAGTADAGSDFTPLDATVVVEADQTQMTVSVPVASSPSAVDDRTVQLALSDEQGAGIEFARARATGVIGNSNETASQVDADYACDGGLFDIVIVDRLQNPRCLNTAAAPFQTVLASSPIVDPAAGVAVFELVRRAGGGRAWFAWETVDGSARAGVDFVASSGTVRMAASQTSRRVVVPLLDAAGADGDRSFTLHLSSGHAGQDGFSSSDGTATIRFLAPAVGGTPRVGQALSGAAPGADTRQWQRCDALGACWPIAGATAASYTPTADDLGGRLRVRATVAGDGGRTIAARTPATAPVRGVVTTPALGGGPAEGSVDAARTVTFTLGGKESDAAYECSVDGDPFGACGEDGGGVVTLSGLTGGPRSFAVRQRTVDDLTSPVVTRNWSVAGGPDGVTACDGTPFTTARVDGRWTVACDDGLIRPWQRVAVRDATVTRPNGGSAELRFAVARPEAGNPVFLDWSTGGGSGVAGSDYTAASGRLVLEADQTDGEIAVPIAGRDWRYPDFTVDVSLSDAQGTVVDFQRDHATGWVTAATAGGAAPPLDAFTACEGGDFAIRMVHGIRTADCELTADQAPFPWMRFSAQPTAVDPRAGLAAIAVTRPADDTHAFLGYATADGTATAGAEYAATAGEIAFITGRSRFTTVPVSAAATVPPAGRSFALELRRPTADFAFGLEGGEVTLLGAAAISGEPKVGVPLHATAGFDAYRWERCDAQLACAPIAGATTADYTPVAADAGALLRVRTTRTDPAGGSVYADAPLTGAVAPAAVDPDPRTPDPRDPDPRTPEGGGDTPGGGTPGGGTPGGGTPGGGTPGDGTPGGGESPGGGTTPGGARPSPKPRVRGVRQQNRSVTRAAAGVTSIVLHCSRRCTLSAPLTISARDARRLGLRSTRIGVARGSAADTGLVRLRVRLNARAKPLLLATPTLLRVVAVVPNPAGEPVRVSFGLKPAVRSAR